MKDQIIAKALELFILQGYKNVSLLKIAGELGITKGGFYHYFSSKDELLLAVFELILNQFTDMFQNLDLTTCTLIELIHYIEVSLIPFVDQEVYSRNYEYMISAFRINPSLKIKVKEKYDAINTTFATIIARDIDKGTINSIHDPMLLALEFGALFQGLMLLKEFYSLDDFANKSSLIFAAFYKRILA